MAESGQLKLAVRPNPEVPFSIVYQDGEILVIDKPAGVVTQPGKGHSSDSLLNGLFSRFGNLLHNMGEKRDDGLLHRLDKDTSGLLVVAIRPRAYDELRADFENRLVDKEYLAIVRPRPAKPNGVIQARLREITGDYKKVVVSPSGQDALSVYRTISASGDSALLAVIIKTGRLHQIRAHAKFIGAPILGDTVYGPAKSAAPRICLHAATLGFRHPATRQWRHFTAPLPVDMLAIARRSGLTVPAQWCHKQTLTNP